MTIKSVEARCINCKEEVKREYTKCRKCGDPVRIGGGKTGFVPPLSVSTEMFKAEMSVAKPAVRLSGEQQAALEEIGDWFAAASAAPGIYKSLFRLFGPAGVGKTTLIKELHRELAGKNIVYGAYTGKAAHVMRQKGIPATTIHSAIYHPVDNFEARAELRRLNAEMAELMADVANVRHDVERAARLTEVIARVDVLTEAVSNGVEFELNPESEWADADLIVLDEVSMVNEDIGQDIESFGVPILVLGDPFQLPPVEGGGYWTTGKPDVLLKEPHRFYLDSQVGRLATYVRTKDLNIRRQKVDLAAAMAADQILCWKNSTRHALTEKIRAKLGRPAGMPVPGDRVMCLVNNKDIGVFNGQQFEVLDDTSELADNAYDPDSFLLRDDDGQVSRHYFDPDGFRGADGEKDAKARRRHKGRVGLFTFANVITVHKAQGSGWPHVYVVDQTHKMFQQTEAEKRRWAYTAVTRASDRVTLASTEA
jgi:exodeoxyribonuclease-5